MIGRNLFETYTIPMYFASYDGSLIRLPVHLSVYVYLSISICLYLSIYLSIDPFICLSFYLSIYLAI